MKERKCKRSTCYAILLALAIILSGILFEFKNYGAYSPEPLNYDVEEKIVLPRECFERLLGLSSIELKQCPRFALLHTIPTKEVTLSSQDLMVIYLNIGFSEKEKKNLCEELENCNFVSITYNCQTDVFSLGFDG